MITNRSGQKTRKKGDRILPRHRSWLGRILGALPSTFLAGGFVARSVYTDDPLTLRAILGDLTFWWAWTVVTTSLVLAVVACLPPKIKYMMIEVILRIIIATMLTVYVVALLSEPRSWIGAGLVLALAAHHIVIWREIVVYRMPALIAEGELLAELGGDHDGR